MAKRSLEIDWSKSFICHERKSKHENLEGPTLSKCQGSGQGYWTVVEDVDLSIHCRTMNKSWIFLLDTVTEQLLRISLAKLCKVARILSFHDLHQPEPDAFPLKRSAFKKAPLSIIPLIHLTHYLLKVHTDQACVFNQQML